MVGIPTFAMAATPPTAEATSSLSAGITLTPAVMTPMPIATPRPWPLPKKLVKRILELEFVDMAELVPDSWQYTEEDQPKCCHQPKRQRRGPVADILLWVECFSYMVEVLTTGHPQKTPEFMAYQRTIVRAQRSFSGEGWITYDTCFRRKAAATKSLDWGQVDFTLYNETFTGRAKAISRCKFCSSEHHTSTECQFAPEAKQSTSSRPTSYTRFESSRPSTNICHLYNNRTGNRCRFNPCKFTHTCTECSGSHPASQCRSKHPPSKFSRSDSPGAKGRK